MLPEMAGGREATRRAASAVKALARHACGRAALLVEGAEAALAAAAGSQQGVWAPALAEALEMLRRPPEQGPGPATAGAAPRLCAVCGAGASSARLKQCAGCRGLERWCSAECQRSSWAGHRAVCLERRAAAAAAEAAAAGGSQQAV
jgi:hypothetical protein